MGKALYRKYRSRRLEDIVGQSHVTEVLARAIAADRVAHAYLFTGPRGVGKTSIARILAHEINGLEYTDEADHLDIIEIDAASNNGVDDIRDLREKVRLAPVSAPKKVYIIDEVHMLSKPAFNALLKTLEEPPEHVVFILATTDVEKLPETIVSRTQRHTFRRASAEHIVENLQRIAKTEKIAIEDDALQLIAQHSDGSFRDSVSLLDQLAHVAEKGQAITAELIENSLGLAPSQALEQLVAHLSARDFEAATGLLSDWQARGIQAKTIAHQLILHLTAHIHEHPDLLPLIGELLTVGQSSLPEAKLLAVVGLFCVPAASAKKPAAKAAAVAAPASVAIPALETKATQPHPKDDIVKHDIVKHDIVKPTPKKPAQKATGTVDWPQLVEAAKAESIGLATLLGRSTGVVEDGQLHIYTRNEFNRKKLSAANNQPQLHALLRNQTGQDWEVTFIPSPPPPKDSKISAVAAIMGGGEEVELGE